MQRIPAAIHFVPKAFVTVLTLCAMAYSINAAAVDNAVAANVGGSVITEANIENALPKAVNRTPENMQAVLENLITQLLIARQAKLDKLDKDPNVLAAVEAAQVQILVKAYVQRLAQSIPEPSSGEIKAYYDAHPELFSQHAVYRLQEIAIAASRDQLEAVAAQYNKIKTFSEMAEWLKLNKINFTPTAAEKGAEEIPADLLKVLPSLKPNQVIKVERDGGLSIIQMLEKMEKPKSLAEATPDIQRFLMNQALGNKMKLTSAQLREKVKIEYFSPYKKPASSTQK